MKRIAVVVLTLVVISSFLYAQQKSSAQLSKEYIDVLGSRLRLGMTKADVAEKLVGVKALFKEEDEWAFDGATIQFKNGRLNFADREWVTAGNTPVDALFGLVTSLNSEGLYVCNVFTDTRPDPAMTSQRVWLRCGNKAVLILKNRIGDKTYEDVYEQLGSLEAREK